MPSIADLRKAEAKDSGQLVLIKTNIGGWFFDAFFKMEHNSSLKITEYPVQTGATISDHAYLQPQTLIMDIGMSDVAKPIYDQFSGAKSRSIRAFEILQSLQTQRIPIQVVTRLKIYQNMLVESIITPDDFTTMFGFKATVTLKEIIVVTVKTVKISARPQVTGQTNKGAVNPIKPTNKSVIKQMSDAVKGKGK